MRLPRRTLRAGETEANAVTADEIRKLESRGLTRLPSGSTLVFDNYFEVLRELAAQLADLNSNLKTFGDLQRQLQLDFLRGDVR
jgi:hypothetical protein